MTDFSTDENIVIPTNPLDEESNFSPTREINALPLLLDLFRWTTPHEINTSFVYLFNQIFPESKMVYLGKDPSGTLQIKLHNVSQELLKDIFIDPLKYAMQPESKTTIIKDYKTESSITPIFPGTSSSIFIAQFYDQDLTGFLLIEHPQPGFFNREDAKLVESAVEAYSIATYRADRFEALTQKASRQAQFLESIAQLYQQETPKDVYQTFLNIACQSLNIAHAEVEIEMGTDSMDTENAKEMES